MLLHNMLDYTRYIYIYIFARYCNEYLKEILKTQGVQNLEKINE